MKNELFKFLLIGSISVFGIIGCEKSDSNINNSLQSFYSNTLNISGIPVNSNDRSVYSFSDQGAWHSYTLSPVPSGGFVGPYLMSDQNGLWLSDQLITLDLVVGEKLVNWNQAQLVSSDYLPGRLEQKIKTENLLIKQKLIFISNRSTLVEYEIESSNKQPQVSSFFTVKSWLKDWSLSLNDSKLVLQSDSSNTIVEIQFNNPLEGEFAANSYKGQKQDFDLNVGFPVKLQYVVSTYFYAEERDKESTIISKSLANPLWAFENNQKRWEEYLTKALKKLDGSPVDEKYSKLAVKSLNTLINNWRSAAGELKHDGLFPSYAYGGFHGFWSWDSWKHSVGLADIVPQLAKDQILTMYDYQDIDGMIADCIFRDTLIEKHNWRDTKPPLSAWSIAKVFEATNDSTFVKGLYSKLKKYHQWWYEFRDHDQNGLCEYGSTDGTRVAAAWESGMDNAVRFDDAIMLSNEGGGYSLNQESVDLNVYLYAEKLYLVQLSEIVGNTLDQQRYLDEANQLKELVRSHFYSQEDGFFFDVMHDGKKIKIFGPEGWIALWAGLAQEDQAKFVVQHLLDSSKFNTKVPFPTLDASHEKFNPKNGYWRGPVWLDQAYFAINGMEKYGFQKEANELKRKLFENAEGLLDDRPIRENYHPITGEGLNANHFSWSAAHLLMLIRE